VTRPGRAHQLLKVAKWRPGPALTTNNWKRPALSCWGSYVPSSWHVPAFTEPLPQANTTVYARPSVLTGLWGGVYRQLGRDQGDAVNTGVLAHDDGRPVGDGAQAGLERFAQQSSVVTGLVSQPKRRTGPLDLVGDEFPLRRVS
jgi:hypothetical protein